MNEAELYKIQYEGLCNLIQKELDEIGLFIFDEPEIKDNKNINVTWEVKYYIDFSFSIVKN